MTNRRTVPVTYHHREMRFITPVTFLEDIASGRNKKVADESPFFSFSVFLSKTIL